MDRIIISLCVLASALVCGSVSAQTIYPMGQQDPASFGLSSIIMPWDAQNGWQFTANSDGIIVTRLGAFYPDGATTAHTVTLFDVSTQAILAQVACGPGSGWQFTDLATSLMLTNGSEYVVTGHTTGSGYMGASTSWRPSGDVNFVGVRWDAYVSASTFPSQPSDPNQLGPNQNIRGMVDFGYTKDLSITTDTQLPSGSEQSAYSKSIQAINGTAPYTWSLASGSLPSGLTLTQVSQDFQFAGTSNINAAGTYNFDVMVTDAANATDVRSISLYIRPLPTTIPFDDDFSTDKAWEYGVDWQRGPTVSYNATLPTRSEPAADNTPSTDNNIAGHLIGADYPANMNSTVWLTSPPVDCSTVATVSLRYYRWLGCSIFDNAVVEITIDGSNWINVWTAPTSSNTNDTAWAFMDHDISAMAAGSASVQVRFGIGPTGGIVNTGWCIDDFQIIDPTVPVVPLIEVSDGNLVTHNDTATGSRDFGGVLLTNNSASLTITISNTGGADLVVTNVTLGGADAAEFTLNTSGFTSPVAKNGSQTFELIFSPTTSGIKNATISFVHDDSTVISPFIINITGTGVLAAPTIEVRETGAAGSILTNPAPASGILNFGQQDINGGSTTSSTIYIENTGTADLILGLPAFNTATANFTLDTSGFPTSLAIGASASFIAFS